jgi:DNA-binding MarR family transcriptional regulator
VEELQSTETLLQERGDFRAWWSLARAYHSVAGPIERFFDERKITGAQYGVLRCLTDAGEEGLMLSDLSRRLLVTCGNITGVVDRLEAAGYLRRERSEEDRRVVRARLTETGRAFYAKLLPDYLALVGELMSGLNERELEALGVTAQRLYGSLDAGKAGVPPELALTPPFPPPLHQENG